MEVRRIVTGQTSAGAAVVSDTRVEPITVGLMPGAEFHAIWGGDSTPAIPTNGSSATAPTTWFPGPGGFRFGLFTLGPANAGYPSDFDLGAAITELGERLPGMLEVLEPDHPGMHTTDTVDYVIVLSGATWLELDNGERHLVRAGDVVVQNGTRHAWHNAGEEPCVMAVAIIGADRTA
jgi:hypothetical protein